jgi:hypothetical protein
MADTCCESQSLLATDGKAQFVLQDDRVFGGGADCAAQTVTRRILMLRSSVAIAVSR